MNRYSTEEKQQAIDLYFKNGCNMKKTVRELGYGSATGILRWLRETVPDKVSKPVQRNWKVDYPEEIKQAAVIDLCESNSSTADIAEKYGISRATLYEWKVQYIGKGNCILKQQKLNSKEYYINEINRLKEEKKLVEQELKKTQAELYRAHLEKDVYEKAAEILKKEMGNNLKEFSNQEKAMVIIALRDKYPVKRILEVFDMAKSSYCYQQKQIKKENKIVKIKERIKILFFENHKRYGYRRIHLLLKREGIIISEKIVRSIMKEENLIVRIIRQKKYSSYLGEISPAVPNEIQRDFHADKPNKKWLTDITEFKIGEGKVYLSPIIDCFDGMPITWTVGTSPNAELVNTMLDNAIVLLKENEHPIVHSDRGCHYRWSGWIQRMDEAGLTRSMSKKGCSPDNSTCEGFFGRMKNEMFYGEKWDKISVEEFISIINQYMQWYRDKRIKLSLGGLSPMEYRRSLGIA
jgi:putative transposase